MEERVWQTVKDTYVYGYPVVGMYELLHSQVLGETKTTGFLEFDHHAQLATPQTTFIPAPNNDTTYSKAWLDLSLGPVILDIPDTGGRFYSVQVLDLYSETVCNIGKRLYGTEKRQVFFAGPGFSGTVPEGLHAVYCNTAIVLCFLRILIGSKEELDTVRDLQKDFRLHYLNDLSSKAADCGHLPKYNNDSFRFFFQTLGQIMALSPSLKGEEAWRQRIEEIQTMPEDLLDDPCRQALKEIDGNGLLFGENVNNWRLARSGIGTYGVDYLQRAVVWYKGALANVPVESLYPSAFLDRDGGQLNGIHSYELHFASGNLPPVSQFWSLTMYRFSDGLLTENDIDRYSVGDRTEGLIYGEDGSLTIYLGSKPPRQERKANWLPAPETLFYVTLRLYGPKDRAVRGEWAPPPILKTET